MVIDWTSDMGEWYFRLSESYLNILKEKILKDW